MYIAEVDNVKQKRGHFDDMDIENQIYQFQFHKHQNVINSVLL